MDEYSTNDSVVPLDHPALLSIAHHLCACPAHRKYYSSRILKIIDSVIAASGLDISEPTTFEENAPFASSKAQFREKK